MEMSIPDSMVLLSARQTEPIQLLCFPSAPPVHVSSKREAGGVVMPISMRGGGGWVGVGQKGEVVCRAGKERCCKL